MIEAKCMECDKEEVKFFVWDKETDKLSVNCYDCTDDSNYFVPIEDFFESPEDTIDWLAHMYGKNWFRPTDFFEVMKKLRDKTRR